MRRVGQTGASRLYGGQSAVWAGWTAEEGYTVRAAAYLQQPCGINCNAGSGSSSGELSVGTLSSCLQDAGLRC